MAFGITSTGFVAKSTSDVQADLQAALRAQFGNEINLTSASVFGQLVALMAEPLAELWALAQAVYGASFPITATGQALDNLAQLTGVQRKQPTHSTVSVTMTGTNGTVVPASSVFSVVNVGSKFQTTVQTTIGGSPTSVACAAIDFGPVAGPAGTITNIDTPIAGLTSVTNPTDAVLGSALETDAALRTRRESELRQAGNAILEAIRSDVLAVAGVTQCTVFENVTDVTDGTLIPPHAVNVVVLGGDDTAVANAIFASKAAGIALFGGATGGIAVDVNVTDSMGIVHVVEFERPGTGNISVRVDVARNVSLFPADGVTQIKNALNAYVAGLLVGGTVYRLELAAICLGISGVIDLPVCALTLGNSPPLITDIANLTPAPRAKYVLPLANITVNLV